MRKVHYNDFQSLKRGPLLYCKAGQYIFKVGKISVCDSAGLSLSFHTRPLASPMLCNKSCSSAIIIHPLPPRSYLIYKTGYDSVYFIRARVGTDQSGWSGATTRRLAWKRGAGKFKWLCGRGFSRPCYMIVWVINRPLWSTHPNHGAEMEPVILIVEAGEPRGDTLEGVMEVYQDLC